MALMKSEVREELRSGPCEKCGGHIAERENHVLTFYKGAFIILHSGCQDFLEHGRKDVAPSAPRESPAELRELDAWIAENVFGHEVSSTWELVDTRTGISTLSFETKSEADGFLSRYKGEGASYRKVEEVKRPEQYTTDAAASDMLDDAILRKLPVGYSMSFSEGMFWMERPDQDSTESACHADKKICRVLFARKLRANGKTVLR